MALKVRRRKTKLHIQAPKPADKEQDHGVHMDWRDGVKSLESVVPLPSDFLNKLPFVRLKKETDKDSVKMVDSVNDDNDQSQLQERERMKKKDRRKLRHDHWMQKIEVCRMAREAAKVAEKRKKTVIVGDLNPLLTALNEIESSTMEEQSIDKHVKRKRKKSQPKPYIISKRTIYGETEHFKEVLVHPAFQADPLGAVTEHIKNVTAMNRVSYLQQIDNNVELIICEYNSNKF